MAPLTTTADGIARSAAALRGAHGERRGDGTVRFGNAATRSPHVQFGGLYMLAQTVDKLRATLPGGNLGSYRIAGFSAQLLWKLGIEEDALRDDVAS